MDNTEQDAHDAIGESPNYFPLQSSSNVNNQQWNYFRQIQDFKEEINYLKAFLDGSMPYETEDKVIFTHPVKVVKYIEIEEGEKTKYIHEHKFDEHLHTPTGKTKEFRIPIRKPLANEQGQTKILNWVAARLTPGTVLSTYSIERIYLILDAASDDLQFLISSNMENWEIAPTQYKSIIETIMDRLEAAYRRAMDGIERDNVTKQTSVMLSGQQGGKKSNSGLWGQLFSSSKF